MRVSELKRAMDRRFDEMSGRFEASTADANARFEAVDRRFEAIDMRFEAIDMRFEAVDRRFDELERRIETTAADTRRYFDVVAEQLRSDVSLLAGFLETVVERLDRHIAWCESNRDVQLSTLTDHELRLRIVERGQTPN